MQILPVILSGGSGTRLWPVSRTGYPKQLQALHGEKSLLQQTAMRLASMKGVLPPVILCNAEQRFLVAEQLREAEIEPGPVILEPVARSTAPAIAIAALHTPLPEETVMIVMPADHFIADHESFQQAVQKAAALAMTGKLMTMGIRPTFAHTGFGYIEQGKPLLENKDAFTVNRFKEKPDAKTAQSYVDAGTYLWNSGIFVLRADAYISELERLQPAIVGACREALAKSKTDLDFLRLHEASFAKAPDISIDYAVMEQARNVAVLPVSFEWNDIGGWPALWQIGEKDENGNVTKGDVVLKDTTNSYIRSDNRLVSVIGLDNVVVVDTSDALLVANKSRVDEVKDVVAQLKHDHRSEGDTHARVWRPWGYYEQLDSGHRFQVKQIMVKPGGKLSLQKHHHRAEHWIVVSGTAKVQCDDEIKLLGPNESIYIPLGSLHRLENPGLMPLFLIEVQSGDYLGEDDIVRFEDIYKRNDH
jgi:mannose-1-phosphate guanylyltransferase/mannose-6-phosphate isomerase